MKLFKHPSFPYIELRYISHVNSCDKMHQHNELTITAIKKGRINILFSEENTALTPNALSIVNPNETHCATLSSIETFGCYVLYIDKKFAHNIQTKLFNTHVEFSPIKSNLIENRNIYSKFIKLCDTLLKADTLFIEKEALFIEFISELFLQFCTPYSIIQTDTKNPILASNIQNYLHEHKDDDIKLEDISKNLNISVVHLLRVFKKEFNLPIHSYILNGKVHHAKKLLAQNISISEVAQLSGFFDQSHLNKSFKRVFQLTPKEYQKNIC